MIMENNPPELPVGKEYWKSLDSLAETPGFEDWVAREFPEGASMLDGVQRRSFVKLMAASFGLAGLGMSGCRRPEHVILPYGCLLYTSPSPRDAHESRMPSSA